MKDTKNIVEEFIKHSKITEETQLIGDYKKGNKSHEVLLAIRDQLKEEPELAKEVFDELFLNENPYLLYVCSVYAIVLDYRRDEALKLLEKIAGMGIKLTSFHAEITLELYESGELFELHGVSEKR